MSQPERSLPEAIGRSRPSGRPARTSACSSTETTTAGGDAEAAGSGGSDSEARVAGSGRGGAAGAAVAAAGVTVVPLVILALTLALVIGGDLKANRAPDSVTPPAVHFIRATAAGLGVVAVSFVLYKVMDF